MSKINIFARALQNQFDHAKKALASNFIILSHWDITALKVEINDLIESITYYEPRVPAGVGDNDVSEEDARKQVQEYGFEVSLRTSQSMLRTLNSYFLPLLYGLLGSLAYILRTLTDEIRAITFSRASTIRYMLRWPLGMLAGITVGFFFQPQTLTGFAVIQPLALAFLAGYSVEMLFTGLDCIVNAFTDRQTTQRPPRFRRLTERAAAGAAALVRRKKRDAG